MFEVQEYSMDTLQAILTRRSIRKYKPDGIVMEDVEKILRAGMQAPSARNLQPWHFILIDQREVLDRVPEFHPYSSMVPEAPAAIVICGDLNEEPSMDYINQNCSAATENMLLAAHALGLGGVWLGIQPREERVEGMRKLLNLPPDIIPVSMVVLGHPDEKKGPADRYRPGRIHHNRW
jgi:nitroreductase